jgi:poly(3-hydroxybutyrate) depolymerase
VVRILFLFSILVVVTFDLFALAKTAVITEQFAGRDMIIYVPASLPPLGKRSLVVVLHGGMGNAQRIVSEQSEKGLNLNAIADKNGFVVVYLNGTPVTKFFGADKLGWNAGGGCCGQSAEKNVDDVSYIKGALDSIVSKYGIDRRHIYGIGHSNGAMMTQRLMCETNLYAAAIAISGPLNTGADLCSLASGKRILAIHGTEDENVPVAGGRGTKGLSRAVYASEERSRQVFLKSKATYDLQLIKGAEHQLDTISNVIDKTEHKTIALKAAQFFGLAK